MGAAKRWLWVGAALVAGAALAGALVLTRSPQVCLMTRCLGPIRACDASEACSSWMECIQACGDDQMLCPTVCGAFYQAPEVNALTRCALDAECIEIDFSGLPPCAPPRDEPVPVGDLDGSWWVSAIRGHDYVLYDDCQRFAFATLDERRVSVHNTTHVSHAGQTRAVHNLGAFTRAPDGTLELVYDNWVGYREHYDPMYASGQAMVMHVCSEDTTGAVHDYGALVLTRAPLDELDAEERAALEAAVREIYGVPLGEFRAIGTRGCAVDPALPG